MIKRRGRRGRQGRGGRRGETTAFHLPVFLLGLPDSSVANLPLPGLPDLHYVFPDIDSGWGGANWTWTPAQVGPVNTLTNVWVPLGLTAPGKTD